MKISKISLLNFRNIKKADFDFSDKLMINGKNGSGKTSIIEASYILLSGKSFKTHEIKECIKKGEQNFFIKCELKDFNLFNREISIGYSEEGLRKILIDKINSSRKELMNIVFSVLHTPDDMELITGGPKWRRNFIDRICFMNDNSYFDNLIEYNNFIKQKNSALKKGSAKSVRYLNTAALELIENIREKRKNGCIEVNKKISRLLKDFFPQTEITLNPYIEKNTEEKLFSRLEKEMEKGFALYGPHLDPLNIQIETEKLKNTFSMGEIYLLSLILKFSEIEIYREKRVYPTLFIDDAFVFLDEEREEKLYKIIIEMKNQVIMTSSTENNLKQSEISNINLNLPL
ncbi:MAG: DNA replication/repair protein RecF [bacterium]